MKAESLVSASLLLLVCMGAGPVSSGAEIPPVRSWRQVVEQDWVLSEKLAVAGPTREPVSTMADAAGGCDGIKNGEWGFHTGQSKEPWWQVDLGKAQPLGEVKVWNRGAAAERAAHMRLL